MAQELCIDLMKIPFSRIIYILGRLGFVQEFIDTHTHTHVCFVIAISH